MSLVETPKKKVSKREQTSVKEHTNDYCRICRCKFKLARCSKRLSSTASVLIICPLSWLIQDEIVEAESLGLTGKYLGEMFGGI
jgi:hypothetical protein